jgi:hypothetical protein
LGSEPGGELKQRLVVSASGGQLHAADGAGDCGNRHSGKTEGRGVTEKSHTRLAVVGAGGEAGNGRAGEQQKLVLSEQFIDACAEIGVALAQSGDLRCGNARSPLKPLANGGLEAVEVAGVQARRLPRLNGRKDLDGLGPKSGIEGVGLETKCFKLADGCVEAGGDLRFAVVEKAVRDGGKSREDWLWDSNGGRERVGKQRRVFEVAKEPAHGVKGLSKVRGAAPVATVQRGSITGQSAECGGDTN